MQSLTTLRTLSGLSDESSAIRESALIIIDAQNTYCEGVMALDGVDQALKECRGLLDRFRAENRPIFHIQHDAGPGSPYDISQPIGQIVPLLEPAQGEHVVIKKFPNAFTQTSLDAALKKAHIHHLILVGFMTHMCVNSTARGAFSLGYRPTVVASATATRALPLTATQNIVSAELLQLASLAALGDLPAAVVATTADVPE